MARSLVNSVAAKLMMATATNAREVSAQVLAYLVRQLDVDASFLRHNDHELQVSTLVAEWPPRPVSEHDPLPWFLRKHRPCLRALRGRQNAGRGGGRAQCAGLPAVRQSSRRAADGGMRAADFRAGDNRHACVRKVRPQQLEAGRHRHSASGRLAFAHLQARVTAEERLHYLAEHDDLTGLHNRRALVAHLSKRLATTGQGPVAVLFLDLDRLKSINDRFGHSAGDWCIKCSLSGFAHASETAT